MFKKIEYWSNSKSFAILLKVVWIIVVLLAILCLARACAVCNYRAHIVERTGYLPENEDWDVIPDIEPPYAEDDTLDLPKIVMLEQYFPPIGDQEDKGTCVAWAVGYNLKTALNAIDRGWTPSMLSQPAHQTSPKDLFLSIPQSQKGTNCNGAGFESAFNVMVTSGAASMETVPYQDLRGCNGVGIGDTTNRIAAYYHVINNGGLPKLGQLKSYIADTIPLVIGARLGDRFMQWSNDQVISRDTYRYTGMHAHHAIVIVGYDDNRHAFRIRNSWGTGWGDNGSIWVDYGFFYREFCFAVFIAENHN